MVKNIIFFTGEAATGKTFISHQLSRFLEAHSHLKTYEIHLGDRVRGDQKEGREPAYSFREKTNSKILLNKDEIHELMNHYLAEVPDDTECILVEGFPRTKDDIDLMTEELRNRHYNNAKINLVSLSFEDEKGSMVGMQKRQEIPEKFRDDLINDESRNKKAENYLVHIKPAIEYFKEKFSNNEEISLIELKLKEKDFFENFKEGTGLNESVFQRLIRKLPYDFDLEKYEKENHELSKQAKIKFK